MKTIQVFDPALCCSTGICGVDIDPALATFAADVEWARGQGACIERVNLAQQPQAFVDHPIVKSALDRFGDSALPIVLVDDVLALQGRYPRREELARWLQAPPPASTSAAATPTDNCCSPAAAANSNSAAAGSKCC